MADTTPSPAPTPAPAPAPASAPATVQPQNSVPLEVDDTLTDNDSALGDGISSYAASLSSSVNQVVMEYGRKFHVFRESNGSIFPADEQEGDRLDMFHAMIQTLLDDNLHLAPIGSHPQRVIDLGTGTGIWAIDFADKYPSAEVIGIDIAPMQPNVVPPNLRFLLDDMEQDWEYENNPFDYVHARFLAACIKDWPRLMEQAYNCVKPGGWVEFQDWATTWHSTDGTVSENSGLLTYVVEAAKRREAAGYLCHPGGHLEKWIKDAGFVNVKVVRYPLPLGTWPKDPKYKRVGAWNYYQTDAALEGQAIGCLVRTPGEERVWSPEEITVLCAQARSEMKDPRVHAQAGFYVVYGQKPEEK